MMIDPAALTASTHEADILITVGMIILNANTAAMIIDDESHVHKWKGLLYGAAQLLIGYANASVELYISAALLVVGAALWFILAYQSMPGGTDD